MNIPIFFAENNVVFNVCPDSFVSTDICTSGFHRLRLPNFCVVFINIFDKISSHLCHLIFTILPSLSKHFVAY